jgi:hypothetical protein
LQLTGKGCAFTAFTELFEPGVGKWGEGFKPILNLQAIGDILQGLTNLCFSIRAL